MGTYRKNIAVKKAFGTVAPYVKPLVELVPVTSELLERLMQEIIDKLDYYKTMRIMPKLYSDLSRDEVIRRVPLDQGVAILEDIGFHVIPNDISIVDAAPKYRRCADKQIIYTDPSAGEKVAPDGVVSVIYITQDVIDRSQELYEEQEKEKREVHSSKHKYSKGTFKRDKKVEPVKTANTEVEIEVASEVEAIPEE